MSYVQETLAPNEDILIRAHFNWTYSVAAVFWAVLGVSPAIYAFGADLLFGKTYGEAVWVYGLSAVPAVLGLVLLLSHWVHLATTEIVVTSSRFIYKTGLISRETKEVSLTKIEEINLAQSILGRIFGFGHITLRGTGVGVIELPDIDNPIQVRRTIEGAKDRMQKVDDRSTYPTEDARADEAPLTATRAAEAPAPEATPRAETSKGPRYLKRNKPKTDLDNLR